MENIKLKTLNYLKSLVAETVSNAKSGHTGTALGASSIMLSLFHDHLSFDVNGDWPNRDRFVFSAGHASALLYATLHMFGFDISINDLKNFRKYGSKKTSGHPEYDTKIGIETSTGPLGQGVANAVGFALGEEKMHALFPNLIDHYTYCFCGDGCLMEGVAVEACSIAGTMKLKKLILLYDDNNTTIDGTRDMANNEDVAKKFEAMGWNYIIVKDGNNYDLCSKAIFKAKQSDKPTIIIFKTIIGIGTTFEGTSSIHGHPLNAQELNDFKNKLNISESFFIPQDVYDFCQKSTNVNNNKKRKWCQFLEKNNIIFDDLFKKTKIDYSSILKELTKHQSLSARDVSGFVLNLLAKQTIFMGGSADVATSTKALLNETKFYSEKSKLENNFHFGIREHSMGAISNGLALYNKNFHIFDSTFVSFSNYMLPALRMRAFMGAPVLSILTHDSIEVGEDGPTHQPIEQIGQMRSIIGLTVFRPASFTEVICAYKYFLESQKPTVIALSKKEIKHIAGTSINDATKGAYVLLDTSNNPEVEIFATGREVYLALEIAKLLKTGVRIISVPCESLFSEQSNNYKSSVLLKNPKLKVAIEASNDPIWHKYVGENGLIFGVYSYQQSGNGLEVYKNAGFDAQLIAKQIQKELIKKMH